MRIRIKFEVELPDDERFSEEDITEFVRFELGDNGRMRIDNPLNRHEPRVQIEPVFGTFEWEEI